MQHFDDTLMMANLGSARGVEPEGAVLALAVINQRLAGGGDRTFLCLLDSPSCTCDTQHECNHCHCVSNREEPCPLDGYGGPDD